MKALTLTSGQFFWRPTLSKLYISIIEEIGYAGSHDKPINRYNSHSISIDIIRIISFMDLPLLNDLYRFSPRHYQDSPHSVWHRLPTPRRASVFILLFLGSLGELRVILTKRSSSLRTFPGHISLPGGKADNGLELPWMVSRREMDEEIGLSRDDSYLLEKYGFSIDHVCELPCYLLRVFSAVRPCIGFMRFADGRQESGNGGPLNEFNLRVNPGESSSIFSCPLYDFLYPLVSSKIIRDVEAMERNLYTIKWGGIPWYLRSYTFPQMNRNEASWLQGFHDVSASELDISGAEEEDDDKEIIQDAGEAANKAKSTASNLSRKSKLAQWGKLGSRRDEETNMKIYDVWGFTANVLHDLAELVYLGGLIQENKQIGEEELIHQLWKNGQFQQKERLSFESKMISATPADKASFGEVIPRSDFIRLKRLYKM